MSKWRSAAGGGLLVLVSCGRTTDNPGVISSGGSAGVGQGNGTALAGEAAVSGGRLGSGASPDPGVELVEASESAGWYWEWCGGVQSTRSRLLSALYSPVKEEVAASYDDGRVVLYSVDGDQGDRTFLGHFARTLAFSTDGSLLAEARSTLVLRRLDNGELLDVQFEPGTDCVLKSMRFSPDDSRLMGWSSSSVCVWDRWTGELLVETHPQSLAAGLTNDAVVLATSDAATSLSLTLLSVPSLAVRSVVLEGLAGRSIVAGSAAVSPRGDSVAAQVGTQAQVWSTEGTLSAQNEAGGHERAPIAYSSDGAYALLGAQVFDARTGAPRLERGRVYSSDPSMLNREATRALVPFALEGLQAVAAQDLSSGRELRVFATLPGEPEPGAPSLRPMQDMTVAPGSDLLALANSRNVFVWRLRDDFEKSHWLRFSGGASLPIELSYSTGGTELVSSGDGWQLETSATGLPLGGAVARPDASGDNCYWTRARLSPRNTWLAIGGYEPVLHVRSGDGAALVSELAMSQCNVIAAFSADETLLATSGPALYRTADWSPVWRRSAASPREPVGHPFADVQFVPGNRQLLVSQCDDRDHVHPICTYALHSVETGAVMQTLPELVGRHAEFSREGHWVVSGNTVLHVPSGKRLRYEGDLQLATFMPSGDIVGVAADNSLHRYCRQSSGPSQ